MESLGCWEVRNHFLSKTQRIDVLDGARMDPENRSGSLGEYL